MNLARRIGTAGGKGYHRDHDEYRGDGIFDRYGSFAAIFHGVRRLRTLFGALIDPGADQSNLLGRQRLWRGPESTGSTRSLRRRVAAWFGRIAAPATGRAGARPTWATRPASELAPRPARFRRLRRHGEFIADLRDGDDQQAFLAVTGQDDLAIFTAFERGWQT